MCLYFLHLFFLLFFYLAFFFFIHLCTPPLMLSGSATIPRLQKTGELRIPRLKRLATCPYHVSKILYNMTTTRAQHPVVDSHTKPTYTRCSTYTQLNRPL